ncbi:hypothetical protein [Orrella sp. 11846]|uniref:hypothetical protein n=1 Tax=Orrella sp. 11846 TaxID=3409913 RepID=UPI003B5B8CAC
MRPQWDLGALVDVGFDRIECNTDINTRIYNELEQTLYRSAPMFRIVAKRAK